MLFTRREIIRAAASLPLAAVAAPQPEETPRLAPGAPLSAGRKALIESVDAQIQGLDSQFEKRSYKGSWTMPYRLFRPKGNGPAPLLVYLHCSGGLGDDNHKQLELGNTFGTRVWLLPANQRRFPCYVLAPQTDRGWAQYKLTGNGGRAEVIPGFGDGNRMVLEIVESLKKEFPVDPRRLYIMGQSMGGAGA